MRGGRHTFPDLTSSPRPLSHPLDRHVAVVALGAGKAEVAQRALEVQALPGSLPVQLMRPTGGQLTWVLDRPAAAGLTPEAWAAEGGKKSAWRFPRSEAPK